MGSVALRISRILEHLRLVQKEVTQLATEELALRIHHDLLDDPDLQALRTIKLSVDQLRQVLQASIDFASSNQSLPDVAEFYSLRAERTMQILRYACIGLQLREGEPHMPASLFEELTQMAFDAVDRHVGGAASPPKILPSSEASARHESVAAAG
jgi:hypothetical protein